MRENELPIRQHCSASHPFARCELRSSNTRTLYEKRTLASRGPAACKFPVLAGKVPVLRNLFPVSLSRELSAKSLRHSHFGLPLSVSYSQNPEIPCKIPC